jgi:S-(hydroxymethyl)glutathione dehydrogenase/alcohol dehydrogenase
VKTRGAIVRQAPSKYEVVDLELDDPQQGELRVKMVASGLCHSDDHIAAGDIPVGTYPFAGGHEGGGIVESVGPNTPGFGPGRQGGLLVPAGLWALPLVRHRPPEPV